MKVVVAETYITLNAEKEKVSYAPGAVVDVDDHRGAKMIALGLAQLYEAPVVAPMVSEPAGSAGSDASAERIAAIGEAIARLDPKDPDHFYKKGLPRAAAVEAAFGDKVSAAEIDAALALLKSGK